MLLAIVVVACTSDSEEHLMDRSFLTGQPCSPPCWYGLILNESDEQAVYATLPQLNFIDQAAIHEWGTVWMNNENAKEIRFGCLHPRDKACGGALLSENRLKRIWLSVGYELTVQAVVQRLGAPNYVDYGAYHPEVGGCVIDLNWPQKGIAVRSLQRSSDLQCQAVGAGAGLGPDTRVNTIYYSTGEGFSSQPGGCCARIPWPGFSDR